MRLQARKVGKASHAPARQVSLSGKEVMQPQAYQRRVLLAVAGMTPQVLTETLYALASKAEPYHPTEVQVVTTAAGRARILLELLGEEAPWFSRLYRDYPYPPPRFAAGDVEVIQRAGEELDDIRDEAENAAAADAIADRIRALTADSSCSIHVSIAGGRKTMGYFAGAALSLYGRAQDRLSHVLVSEAFEGNTRFFYPSPRQRVIYTQDNKPLNAADAVVTLADIPFVRLRGWLPAEFLEQPRPFREAIAQARLALEPQRMRIEVARRQVFIGERDAMAPPADLAFFLWVWRRERAGVPLRCPSEGGGEREPAEEFLHLYQRVHEDTGPSSRTVRALRNGMDRSYFLEHRSRWNQFLKAKFSSAGQAFRVAAKGPRGETRYCVEGGVESIEVREREEWRSGDDAAANTNH
ncbi:MAG: TIGR02584 family CRISPR-associated protein [Bryobacterales bacterium]|nr:TIGR02584 family CRISPR-associated protein [Bryobacterales bacterium]